MDNRQHTLCLAVNCSHSRIESDISSYISIHRDHASEGISIDDLLEAANRSQMGIDGNKL